MNYLASKFVENNLEKDFVKPIVPSYNGKTLPTAKEIRNTFLDKSRERFEEKYSQTFENVISDIEQSKFCGNLVLLTPSHFLKQKNAELRKPWTHFGIYFGRFFGHPYDYIYLTQRFKNDMKNVGYDVIIRCKKDCYNNNNMYWELKE